MALKRIMGMCVLWPWLSRGLYETPLGYGQQLCEILSRLNKEEGQYCQDNMLTEWKGDSNSPSLWPPLSIRHILDSWGVFVWSFMIIVVTGKQLCDWNIWPNLDSKQTDGRTGLGYGQLSERQHSLPTATMCNQSRQKDNIARQRQPYVNSNNK